MAKTALRQFIMGEIPYIPTEGLDLMEDSIEARGNPANIATDIRILRQLIRGYRWSLQRGYIGE